MLKGIEKDESKELILPKINIDDPFIATVQNINDQELELKKLNDDEIKKFLDIVDGRNIPDWRN